LLSTKVPAACREFNEIPGPKSLPLIGTLYQYLPVFGKYKFDRLHRNGLAKLRQYGPVVREDIVPGVSIVWIFKPEDVEVLYRKEGRYPKRHSHLALQKYRLNKPDIYNTGGLLPT
jgi:ecdysteroid 25-hydroxylase CYP302A1